MKIWLCLKGNSSVKGTIIQNAKLKQLESQTKSHDLWLYPVVMDILRSGNKETGNLPQASHENSSVSPHGAARLKGTLANFHAWPSGDIKSPYFLT